LAPPFGPNSKNLRKQEISFLMLYLIGFH